MASWSKGDEKGRERGAPELCAKLVERPRRPLCQLLRSQGMAVDVAAKVLGQGMVLAPAMAATPPDVAAMERIFFRELAQAESQPVPQENALPQEKAEPEEKSPSFAATVEEPKKECTPRWDWAGLLRRTESAGRVGLCEVWRQA